VLCPESGGGIRTTVFSVPASSTLRFRFLAEGAQWFDDETASYSPR
jgi:hypothetical protein